MQTNVLWINWLFSLVIMASLLGHPLSIAAPPLPNTPPSSDLQQPRPSVIQSKSITDADQIRVGISNNSMKELEYHSTKLSATGPYILTDKASGKTIFEAGGGLHTAITVNNHGFYVRKGKQYGPFKGPLLLKPKNPVSKVTVMNITRRKRRPTYRGYFEIVRGSSSPKKLSVVNVVPLQDYLKAVIPNELPPRYGYEAVKAQSVAARNYAIRPREKPWPHFDICDSQYCQVYLGSNTEHPQTNKALEETFGLIGLYDGDPILALYSSAHGGHSENYENAFSDPISKVFPGTPLPYLVGNPDIPNSVKQVGNLSMENAARAFWTSVFPSYDVNSPYHRWEKLWSRSTIHSTLNRYLVEVSKDSFTKPFVTPLFKPGQTIGVLKRIHVKKRGVSGKAMVIEIEASNGRWTLEKEFVIRKVFRHGNRMLPSANVVFSHLTGRNGQLVALKANGGGFGHGVGMSQLGASWMSRHGHPFYEIIQHYYRGVAIGTIPLLVGKDHHHQPVRVTFYAPTPTAKLYIETDQPGQPVSLTLNDKPLSINTNSGERTTFQLGSYSREPGLLKIKQRNTLILNPDPGQPRRNIKAWIEIFPPKPGDMTHVTTSPKPSKAKPAAQVCLLGICW